MARTRQGKTRKVDNPYQTYSKGGWDWAVLRHYQNANGEVGNPYARVFCAVRSPYTYGAWEYGDVYCREIPGYDYSAQNRDTV